MNNFIFSTQLIKIAKILVAVKQAKRLLQYLKNDYKDQLTQEKSIEFQNKIQQIQQKSFNFKWFTHRFIQQNKHYQDIDPLLNLTQSYKKLNRQLRTFQFNGNASFSDLYDFMDKYNKNVNNQQFKAPSYCKLIHSDSKYNYYYADAKDNKCFEDLHDCNTKKDGQQYAMWCVVTGTRPWGKYTNSEFPFYVYTTDKKNVPVVLFNFGYTNNAQIKDIHDNMFTKTNNEFINSFQTISEKYNFYISNSESEDMKIIKKIIYFKDTSNIQNALKQNKNETISNQKYFIDFSKQIIIDVINKKLAFIITQEDIEKLDSYNIHDNLLWKLLLDNMDKQKVIEIMAEMFYYNQNNIEENIIWQYIQYLISNKPNIVEEAPHFYKIKPCCNINNFNNQMINFLIENEEYELIGGLIIRDKLNQSFIQYLLKKICSFSKPEGAITLLRLISLKKIQWKQQYESLLINNKVSIDQIDLLVDNINDGLIPVTQQIKKLLIKNLEIIQYNPNKQVLGKLLEKLQSEQFLNFLLQKKRYDTVMNCFISQGKTYKDKQVQQFLNKLIENKQVACLIDFMTIFKYVNKKMLEFFVSQNNYTSFCQFITNSFGIKVDDCIDILQLLITYNASPNVIICIFDQKIDPINEDDIYNMIKKHPDNVLEIRIILLQLPSINIDKLISFNMYRVLFSLFNHGYLETKDLNKVLDYLKKSPLTNQEKRSLK